MLTGAVLALVPAGCASWSYDAVQPGQVPREYEYRLPAAATQRTPLGLCYVSRDLTGRSDVIVLLVTADRRLAGKFHAERVVLRLGPRVQRSYRLRGLVDPGLLGAGRAGPLDVLRAVLSDLVQAEAQASVRQAHHEVAAGLARLIERWPAAELDPAHAEALREALEGVAPGGQAGISITPAGWYSIVYESASPG